ncbi:MAG TPA: alanyl-tRNA editing protein [Caldilineaceae bacterium]|nr:alanyl-tRNA editing protein [Caldilineaceae bacterium]
MPLTATRRLYWQDDYCFSAAATVLAIDGQRVLFDQTPFFPGGGGQPPDAGWFCLPGGESIPLASAQAGEDGLIWHASAAPLAASLAGQPVRLWLNGPRRLALMRYHTALHVLNTVTLRDYDGWITGVQMAEAYARIDFKLEGLSPARCADLATKVNTVLAADHPLRAYFLPEAEFRQRPDLLRTLEARPPVVDGQVRVVEITGFEQQPCGGTHVRSTAAVGHFAILRSENKGKINKRLYVRLEDGASPGVWPPGHR